MKDKLTPVVLALVALALFIAMEAPRPGEVSPKPSEEVPNFTFQADGRTQQLSDLRGHVVILNIWATWCPPCVAEMPSLEHLHQQLSGSGLVVLGISVDQDADAYTNFLRTNHITYPNYRDSSRHIAELYGTYMYPETYIIDQRGRLVRKIVGALQWDDPQVVDFLNDLINQTGTAG